MKAIQRRAATLMMAGIGLLVLMGCHSGDKKKIAKTETGAVTNALISFDFTLDKKSIHDRVAFLDSLGYQGVTFNVNRLKDIDKLKEYQNQIKLRGNEEFSIPAVFHGLNPNMFKTKRDELWKSIMNQLALTQSDIWVIASKGEEPYFTHDEVLKTFMDMCDYADRLHLNVIIYPHDKTFIESAAEAITYIKAANKKNLFLSFHLCHELRAGNGSRINTAIAEVAPYIKMASISGADSIMIENPPKGYWDDAIKPLYKGDFNTTLFFKRLVQNGYKGPVALHTYGLKEPVDEHFVKSMERWQQIKQEVIDLINLK